MWHGNSLRQVILYGIQTWKNKWQVTNYTAKEALSCWPIPITLKYFNTILWEKCRVNCKKSTKTCFNTSPHSVRELWSKQMTQPSTFLQFLIWFNANTRTKNVYTVSLEYVGGASGCRYSARNVISYNIYYTNKNYQRSQGKMKTARAVTSSSKCTLC